jgi:hypothetical protein
LLTGLRDRVRPFWLVFSAAALILALTGGIMLRNLQSPASPSPQPTTRALTTEKTSPTDAPAVQPTAASPTQPAQTALLEGSLLSVAGELELQLRGLDSPGETALYRAILTAPDREALVIGDLAIYNGEAAVAFVHPQGTNILGNYNHLLITYHESPDSDSSDIILDLEFDPAVVDRFRLLEEDSGGADPLKSIASGLTLQAGHYESHRSFTLSSISAGDLAGARSHAEHIINILSGRSGEAYGDWNDNQRTENPGDDVGLQVYMGLLGDLSAGALAGEAEAALQAQELIRALDELQGVIAEALKIAQQVALADSLDVITEFGIADQLDALQVQSQVDAVLGMSQELTLAYQIHFER